ncbi:MAG TPA: Na/Pi cotransporter family protein [Spirochaetota bacterium]|nr:Na/Pi cotransporter family protein [Spirochaetota bacterium]
MIATSIQILSLLGGLGIFLYGIRLLSDNLQKIAGNKIKTIIHYMTTNRVMGVLTGLLVTCIIQSSSATTVFIVSFVNAGLMNITQAVGTIMGANIGTTFTGWIVAILGFKVKIASFALPAAAISIPLLLAKKDFYRDIGMTLMGFGLLFLGLHTMKSYTPDIKNNPQVLQFLEYLSDKGYLSVLIFILTGTLLTFIIQSSSAAMAITITMAYKGWINFPMAAAIVLGENIGTTLTANLAAIPMGHSSKQAARAHFVFNISGIIWVLILFYPFLELIDDIVPGSSLNARSIPAHLAMFHSVFNITNTFILIWLVKPIVNISAKLAGKKKTTPGRVYTFPIPYSHYAGTASVELVCVKNEIIKMSDFVYEMLKKLLLSIEKEEKEPAKVNKQLELDEQYTDAMQEQIGLYLTECSTEALSEFQAQAISQYNKAVNELESIGDSILSISMLLMRKKNKNLKFHANASNEIIAYTRKVLDFISYYREMLEKQEANANLEQAYKIEKKIDFKRRELRKIASGQLRKGADVKAEIVYMDIIRHLEHIGDFTLNVSQAIKNLPAS